MADSETNRLLRELVELSRPSTETTLSLTSPARPSTSSFTVQLPEPIRPPAGRRRLEVALTSLETAYTWPNIDSSNNSFVYGIDATTPAFTITLDTGAYELAAINDEIQRQLRAAGHYTAVDGTDYISVEANLAMQRAVIIISNPTYYVDISASGLRSILGWGENHGVLQQGYNEAPNIVQISKVNSLVESGYGSTSAGTASRGYTLASFFPNVPPGFKVSYEPRSLIWLPVSGPQIQRVDVRLPD